jgi:DNA-binding transcriptional LysR family regulator
VAGQRVAEEAKVELRQLRYFLAVAEELHFGRAAERLQIVQPAVSQQVRRLERELGVRLLDRSGRRVRLTGAGQRFLPAAQAVLAAADRAARVAAALAAGSAGILRLGSSQGMGERLGRVLEALAGLAPDLEVQLVSGNVTQRLQDVRQGRLDATFVRAVAASPGLRLWEDRLGAALPASHPLAGHAALRLEQLRELPLRLAPRDANPAFHDLVMAACRAAGFEPVPGPPVTTPQDTLAAIGTGPPSWTLLFEPAAEAFPTRRVAFRPLAPPLAATAALAVAPTAPPQVKLLLAACTAIDPTGKDAASPRRP